MENYLYPTTRAEIDYVESHFGGGALLGLAKGIGAKIKANRTAKGKPSVIAEAFQRVRENRALKGKKILTPNIGLGKTGQIERNGQPISPANIGEAYTRANNSNESAEEIAKKAQEEADKEKKEKQQKTMLYIGIGAVVLVVVAFVVFKARK